MKCKYWKKCEHYQEDSLTCNKNAGGYYPDGFCSKVSGCYVEMARLQEESKLKRKNNRKINKIINLTKYLWNQGGLNNLKPLFLWLLIIPLRKYHFFGIVAYLRRKRVTFRLEGRIIEGKVAHIGTIKEVIVENGYKIDQEIKGDIIDAGANIGIAQLVLKKMASKNSKMICVEPDPGNVSLLIRNQGLNCEILVAALSDKVGKANFSFASTGITSHFSNGARQSVKVITIDRLTKSNKLKPGLIKIDVEGADLKVLQGARKTLKKFKPIIIIEIHSIELELRIKLLLKLYGYNSGEPRGNNIWIFRSKE